MEFSTVSFRECLPSWAALLCGDPIPFFWQNMRDLGFPFWRSAARCHSSQRLPGAGRVQAGIIPHLAPTLPTQIDHLIKKTGEMMCLREQKTQLCGGWAQAAACCPFTLLEKVPCAPSLELGGCCESPRSALGMGNCADISTAVLMKRVGCDNHWLAWLDSGIKMDGSWMCPPGRRGQHPL